MLRILVLGSGQLGLMLAEAGARWGMSIDLLDIDNDMICYGSSRTPHSLDSFNPEDYDVITIEREHMPQTDLVKTLRQHPGWHGEQALATLANRRTQKELLERLAVPTANWLAITADLQINSVHETLGDDVVLKVAEGGYDGRGQWCLQAANPPTAAVLPAGMTAIAERKVAFTREVSLLGARNRKGQCVYYPLSENKHVAGMLRHSIAPAAKSADLQAGAESILGRIMAELGYEGVMAVELFIENGQLLVNEIAPRVHNSGHWTQRGANLSQFQLHLLAIMNHDLSTPQVSGVNGMVNIVGVEFDPQWLLEKTYDTHWYGKAVRKGRKLGHINLSAVDELTLRQQISQCETMLYV